MLILDLFEAVRPAFLYHGTKAMDDAAKIIAQNQIMPFTHHPYTRLGLSHNSTRGRDVAGVSLTRSLSFAKRWGTVVFVLDQMKLRQRYQIRPIDYYMRLARHHDRSTQAREESEEFLISPNGIEKLDRFLVEITMDRMVYEDCLEDNADYLDASDTRYASLTDHPLLRII